MTQSQEGNVVGRTIVGARGMTEDEAKAEGWTDLPKWRVPLVLILDDGTLLYPSEDAEGNGPGELFVRTKKGKLFMVSPDQGG